MLQSLTAHWQATIVSAALLAAIFQIGFDLAGMSTDEALQQESLNAAEVSQPNRGGKYATPFRGRGSDD